ncbi:MAG: glycosyltransferase family 2 protein [Pseudomonadota bacterium]
MIRVSIITVCYNSAHVLFSTLRSVAEQLHPEVEHIVIDGASQDHTLEIIRQHGSHVTQVVSEPDNGLYDAMNKGLALATGEVVAFLNAGDTYSDGQVLLEVAQAFSAEDVSFVYGDLRMWNMTGELVREWRVGLVNDQNRRQIPHPTLFVRRTVLAALAPAFDSRYELAADVKQQLLLYRMGLKGAYISRPVTEMSLGGASTESINSYMTGWLESVRAYNEVFGYGGIWYVAKKVFLKIKGLNIFLFIASLSGKNNR